MFLGKTQPGYPARLKECPDAPVGLFVRGCGSPDEIFGGTGANVAVVGTRDITKYGEQWCADIVRSLAGLPVKPRIVSGLAYGTDILAHRTALECGLPTVAVMATGPDEVYPHLHRDFARRMAATPGCALVTDYPAHTAPLAVNFIRRNRIIAGLSDAVVLVESAVRGGGMITCRMAFSYDRAVYALPGRGDDCRSQGCNRLIGEGVAQIIESPGDLARRLWLDCGGSPEALGDCSSGGFRGGSPAGRRGGSGCSGGGGGASEACVRTGVETHYSNQLPRDRVEQLTAILLKIREKRGIDIDGLCEETALPHRTVTELTTLLEADGFITVDLLRRCAVVRR